MNTENFIINKVDLETAQETCKFITNPDLRNRAVANSLAANIAEQFFNKDRYYIDTASGLHNIGLVLEDIDIADIYINNSYIDVRIYFEGTELSVPQEHFTNDLLPQAYMFILLDKSLTRGTVKGFILPENINKSHSSSDFYVVDEMQLVSFAEIELSLPNIEEGLEVDTERIFEFVDNKLIDKESFYKELLLSRQSRLKLAQAIKARNIFNFVSLTADNKLNIETEETTEDMFEQELSEYIDESNTYDFSTITSPSLKDDENDSLLKELEKSMPEKENVIEDADNEILNENEQQINALFDGQENESDDNNLSSMVTDVNDSYDENFVPPRKNNSTLVALIIFVFVIIFGVVGYLIFLKINSNTTPEKEILSNNLQSRPVSVQENPSEENVTAMPIENIATQPAVTTSESDNTVAIPEIEQNINASVLVSKLKVAWEVPSGYATNTSAQRYLIKLGKIIQLNLKTELLLLSNPPITNKIAVEIKYNKNDKKFETVGIAISSGEKSVDDLILQTVNRVLAIKLNINSDSFAKLQGNPLLIIRL